jgi:hypothetical protein
MTCAGMQQNMHQDLAFLLKLLAKYSSAREFVNDSAVSGKD